MGSGNPGIQQISLLLRGVNFDVYNQRFNISLPAVRQFAALPSILITFVCCRKLPLFVRYDIVMFSFCNIQSQFSQSETKEVKLLGDCGRKNRTLRKGKIVSIPIANFMSFRFIS